jgi:hypothetical protein
VNISLGTGGLGCGIDPQKKKKKKKNSKFIVPVERREEKGEELKELVE